MAKKKEDSEIVYPALELKVGVNFVAKGDEDETRLEAGSIVNFGVLPASFEASLIEQKKAVVLGQAK